MSATDAGERLRLRFRLPDGDWDAFRRGDNGHAANEEHPALYLIHRNRKTVRGLAADRLSGIEINPDGTETESFATYESAMRARLAPDAAAPDTYLPYQQALTILTRHHQ